VQQLEGKHWRITLRSSCRRVVLLHIAHANTVSLAFTTSLICIYIIFIRHPALVHGGVTALTFDNLLGWLSFLDERPNVLTAYLHVDFKAPLPTATTAAVEVHMEKQEGRKLFFVGSIKSLDGAVTYSTCTSLFVVPKDQKMFEQQSSSNGVDNATSVAQA
jgi:hypothetical protein